LSVCTAWFHNTVTSPSPYTGLGMCLYHLSIIIIIIIIRNNETNLLSTQSIVSTELLFCCSNTRKGRVTSAWKCLQKRMCFFMYSVRRTFLNPKWNWWTISRKISECQILRTFVQRSNFVLHIVRQADGRKELRILVRVLQDTSDEHVHVSKGKRGDWTIRNIAPITLKTWPIIWI
jgi:hypothetical protein